MFPANNKVFKIVIMMTLIDNIFKRELQEQSVQYDSTILVKNKICKDR